MRQGMTRRPFNHSESCQAIGGHFRIGAASNAVEDLDSGCLGQCKQGIYVIGIY